MALKFGGLIAQVTLAIGEQHVTAIITSDAANDTLRLGSALRRSLSQRK
jgi:hypothetical protein